MNEVPPFRLRLGSCAWARARTSTSGPSVWRPHEKDGPLVSLALPAVASAAAAAAMALRAVRQVRRPGSAAAGVHRQRIVRRHLVARAPLKAAEGGAAAKSAPIGGRIELAISGMPGANGLPACAAPPSGPWAGCRRASQPVNRRVHSQCARWGATCLRFASELRAVRSVIHA
jgi:hypothetical protein